LKLPNKKEKRNKKHKKKRTRTKKIQLFEFSFDSKIQPKTPNSYIYGHIFMSFDSIDQKRHMLLPTGTTSNRTNHFETTTTIRKSAEFSNNSSIPAYQAIYVNERAKLKQTQSQEASCTSST
jgi:hypothetical protein